MGHTCGEPNEVELTAAQGLGHRSFSGLHRPHLPFHVPASFPDETGNVVNQWDKYGPDEDIALPKHAAAPTGMPGIAFTYELDGKTEVSVFGDAHPIPGPDNPTDACPFCGPPLPDNATRWMRKGYYLAVTWIDYLAGRIIGELEARVVGRSI